jgi:hypothetical protein
METVMSNRHRIALIRAIRKDRETAVERTCFPVPVELSCIVATARLDLKQRLYYVVCGPVGSYRDLAKLMRGNGDTPGSMSAFSNWQQMPSLPIVNIESPIGGP